MRSSEVCFGADAGVSKMSAKHPGSGHSITAHCTNPTLLELSRATWIAPAQAAHMLGTSNPRREAVRSSQKKHKGACSCFFSGRVHAAGSSIRTKNGYGLSKNWRKRGSSVYPGKVASDRRADSSQPGIGLPGGLAETARESSRATDRKQEEDARERGGSALQGGDDPQRTSCRDSHALPRGRPKT